MATEIYNISKDSMKYSEDNIVTSAKEDEIFGFAKSEILNNTSKILAELIGTALLLFLGCMGCISGFAEAPRNFELSISFGLTVMIVVQIFGCVSGAHVNPSVTVAAYIYNMISLPMGVAYILAQIVGGYLGFGMLKLITPESIFMHGVTDGSPGVCSTLPHKDLTVAQAFFVEYVVTTLLIFVCCAVWDPRNATNTDTIPLRFGFAVGCISIAAGPYTGGSMNPARTLAPAIFNEDYYMHWIYWVAPLSASIITSLAYKTVFRREASPGPIQRVEELLLKQRDRWSA